jgi:hypothetical protein
VCFSSEIRRPRAAWLLAALALSSCGPRVTPGPDRVFVEPLENEVFYNPAEGEAEKYVDFASRELNACDWQTYLEKNYSLSSTGRFRLFGEISLQKPPRKPVNPITVIGSLLSVVDFVMPWNIFRGIKIPNMEIRPWGRVDMRGQVLNSYAFLSEAEPQIPDRKEFLKKVDAALAKRPSQYLKLLAFKVGLVTGTLNAIEQRNKVVEEEIGIVFPGLFSPDGQNDLLPSFAWVLAQNGLRLEKGFKESDLKVYSAKLPVFREGGWSALAEDMSRGLGAAIHGYRSVSARERACAANIIFRSTDQLLQLMGQETLPLTDAKDAQSYAPSLAGILKSKDSSEIRRCSSVGSLVRSGKRVRVDEQTLNNLSKIYRELDWNAKPLPLAYCTPTESLVSASRSPFATGSVSQLSLLLDRMDAFAHYLFAFNPGAPWWKQKDAPYPLGDFSGMKDIQDSKALAPMRVHTLALAFTQLNLLHLEEDHLILLDEKGLPTKAPDQAMGIRLSARKLDPYSVLATTSAADTVKWVKLLTKFERYLKLIEAWSRGSTASTERVNALFGSRENLRMLIGDETPNREVVQKLYLATSLLLLKFVDHSRPETGCYSEIVTDLKTGAEELVGDCGERRAELADAMRKIAIKIRSPLLQRSADELDPPF